MGFNFAQTGTGRCSRDALLSWTPVSWYHLPLLLYSAILEAAHIFRIHAGILSGRRTAVSSSLSYSKQEGGADSGAAPSWSMMRSDIVVFHLCCLDPLRQESPLLHTRLLVSHADILLRFMLICVTFGFTFPKFYFFLCGYLVFIINTSTSLLLDLRNFTRYIYHKFENYCQ